MTVIVKTFTLPGSWQRGDQVYALQEGRVQSDPPETPLQVILASHWSRQVTWPNIGLWLAETCHVTWILASDWSVLTLSPLPRKCGMVVCNDCSNKRFLLPEQSSKPLRWTKYRKQWDEAPPSTLKEKELQKRKLREKAKTTERETCKNENNSVTKWWTDKLISWAPAEAKRELCLYSTLIDNHSAGFVCLAMTSLRCSLPGQTTSAKVSKVVMWPIARLYLNL